MVRTRPTLPAGHGEVVERPGFEQWFDVAESNRASSREWTAVVAGMPIGELRRLARGEFLDIAEGFSAKMGVTTRAPGDPEALIIATGHQPELYHTGVWVKDFLIERFARETNATAVDIMVDSDGFDIVGVSAPCMTPGVARCKQYLALGVTDSCFASTAPPDGNAVEVFAASVTDMLGSLPAPAVKRHFAKFTECMRDAVGRADDLAEFITIARRQYEASVGTGYLEAPLTRLCGSRSFTLLIAHLLFDAKAFHAVYNEELRAYRLLTKTRSAAQPFPDLGVDGDSLELPLWAIVEGRRRPLWVRRTGASVELLVDGDVMLRLDGDCEAAAAALRTSGFIVAPKAVVLTLFARVFCCDLFVHGIGGGRYDQVTDAVIAGYLGVEPPAFAVASMTMYLPLGAHIVDDAEIAAAKDRLNRLEHNPDALLGEVEFETADERIEAMALATEKRDLVARIAAPDADKKSIGLRIKEVNAQLASILAPMREELARELAVLENQRAAADILTDRTYPLCLWDPSEIADKVW